MTHFVNHAEGSLSDFRNFIVFLSHHSVRNMPGEQKAQYSFKHPFQYSKHATAAPFVRARPRCAYGFEKDLKARSTRIRCDDPTSAWVRDHPTQSNN
jgi:hypothetical protein